MNRRLALLLVLYFVQGLPYGFQATALPVYLRGAGVSLTGISLLGLLAWPWMLKALWSPLVDRVGSQRFGRRKSWIVPAQALLGVCCFAASMVSPHDGLALLLVLVLLMNLCAATQDIAVDGLAVDVLAREELGLGNAVQVIGYKLGMLTGGGLLIWASGSLGWSGVFLAMGALVFAALAVVVLAREPPSSADRARSMGSVLAALWAALRLPGAGWAIALIASYKLGEAMVDTMMRPFLVDAGYDAPRIGLWIGTYGIAASLLGSAAGGLLASRRGVRRALEVTSLLRVVPLLFVPLLAWVSAEPGPVIGVILAESFCGSALTTALFAFTMGLVDRRVGASHYTVLASLEVVGKGIGSLSSGPLATAFGYGWVFALGAALSLGFAGLVFRARARLE